MSENNDCKDFPLINNDDEDISESLMKFCMQLVHHSQWKSKRRFICGSFVEVTQHGRLVKKVGVSYDKLDIDYMRYSASRYAIPCSVSLPETYTGDVIRIYTDDVHTGYARLIREKDNIELRLLSLLTIRNDQTIHGPAVMMDTRNSTNGYSYSLSNADTDKLMFEKIQITTRDIVIAVHSPYWPVEAIEWITRSRCHGFPSKSVIKQVVAYGCDFVHVPHNKLSNDNEWRFSFSRAELFIISSWSISQRIVYSTLWVLNKRIASRNLCTYYFKTLMFWACEENSAQLWRIDCLAQFVCQLLMEIMQCVKSKICVNYFIPGNNMMDHLVDTDLSNEIKALWKILQSHQLITKVIDACRRYELMSANTIYHIESPAWIKRAQVVYQRVNTKYDNYTDLFCTDLATDLQNALYIEFSDIYRGLRFHRKSFGCANGSDKRICLLKSESYLLLAVNLCESDSVKRYDIDNCSRALVQSVIEQFMSHGTNVSHGAGKDVELKTTCSSTDDLQSLYYDRNEQKYLLYNRFVEKHETNIPNHYCSDRSNERRNVDIAVYRVTELNTSPRTDVWFFKDWPGRSPTVNISWFIAKAYLANFYYAIQCDISLTIKTCDDIIDASRRSKMNQLFAEKTFPVVLSTQWTRIYDKEIQELLGLYSLCSYVLSPSSRSACIGVCPVWFALYLKLRTEIDQVVKNRTSSDSIIDKCTERCTEHVDVCIYDKQTNNGLLTEYTILILLTRNMKVLRHDTIT